MAGPARKSKRTEILRSFTALVAERGYDEVSLRDVAEAVDVSKGTILHHFRNKESLLEELHGDYMRRRLAEAHELLDAHPDPVDQLQLIVYQLMLAQRDDRAATVAFAREIVRFASEEVMAEVRAMRHEYSTLVGDVIRRGIAAGEFTDVDPSLAALQLFGMCNWSWTWFKPEGEWSAEQIGAEFCRTLLDGLLREGGRELEGERLAQAVAASMRAHAADEPAPAAVS
ncbi:MAG TPA: TetR/AcrR family transcriptional regulator [Solirubrobacterales bacterium]|jgi:AcrR family transcriptional regulator|nr:TetR/AcrR family transcriptional regulator [Solirubrobacterales bacterium]